MAPIRLGISSCLLGDEVRFDGGHKRDDFLVETVGPLVEWVPVCPEVELGLGVPREPMHLVRRDGEIRLVGTRSEKDHTDEMEAYARCRVAELVDHGLHGYVLKARSPSCGLGDVMPRIADEDASEPTVGRFAAVLIETFSGLPVEDEERLRNPAHRRAFLERVLGSERYARLRR